MRIAIITFLLFCCFSVGFAQRNEILIKLVDEGIALHDKGEYEAAIAKYDRALILDPNDYEANYEKSSSCLFAKRYDECIAISRWLIQYHNKQPGIKGVWVNLGSAYDDKGDADSAMIIYNEGIRLFPDFYLLHYNSGLTYARQKKWDEAFNSFMESLKRKPDHAGALYYTALLQEKSNRIASIISGLVFLASEPEGKRAKGMYEYLYEQFQSFAKNDEKGNSTITLSMDDKKKENNFSMVNMMMGLAAAGAITDSLKAATDVDKLGMYIQILTNSLEAGQKEGKGLYWKTYVPFLIEMKAKGLTNDFAHIASITTGNEDNIKWIGENEDKLKAFYNWFNDYKWKQ